MLRRVALASVVANVGIVITGGAVRLTGSGLGCPTVPQCTDDSYVPSPELGIHGAIEFGNRMLTFVVGIVAVLGVVYAFRARLRRPRVVRLAVLVALAVPAQALIGMITVWTGLNPWVVGSHFLVSMAVIAVAYAFWTATGERDAAAVAVPRPAGPLRALAGILVGASAAVLIAGSLVTGSGPHAGDANARRNGLDMAAVAQVHADLVFLLTGLVLATWLVLRAMGARHAAVRAAWLLGIIAAQGLIGFVQYATNLPALLVGLHMAGACAVWLATLALWRGIANAARTNAATSNAATTGPSNATAAPAAQDPRDHELRVMIEGDSARASQRP
jgi:heme a synthase